MLVIKHFFLPWELFIAIKKGNCMDLPLFWNRLLLQAASLEIYNTEFTKRMKKSKTFYAYQDPCMRQI